jgi:hypothetical protein
MHSTGGWHRKERGKKTSRTASQSARRKRRCGDPAKAAVMAYMERLVRDGLASCAEMNDGAMDLTLSSGEVFHLGRRSITRIV